jgi:glutamate-5-semialdehyde dehydrogenase
LDIEQNSDKPEYLIDRLTLNSKRIDGIADGLRQLVKLPDPIGEVLDDFVTPVGLHVKKVRVPFGVIAIIYEARPNVTADAIGLCLKTGNAVLLRGSKDAINSNKAIVGVVKTALKKGGYNSEFIQLVEDTSRVSAEQLMVCRKYVDVLIPRGSAGLIKTVVENSTVPTIETGAGNCHAYVEKTADLQIATDIIFNGKVQRPSVCNALESIVIDRAVAAKYLPVILVPLEKAGVAIVGDSETVKAYPNAKAATDEDFYTEFSALKISVKVVCDYNEAIEFINEHSTKHSEVIISKDEKAQQAFLNNIDSAAVYVNASTRFTDGFEFGFGAEMGISTQKTHARGPLGLKQLTSEKYQIVGTGQVRK